MKIFVDENKIIQHYNDAIATHIQELEDENEWEAVDYFRDYYALRSVKLVQDKYIVLVMDRPVVGEDEPAQFICYYAFDVDPGHNDEWSLLVSRNQIWLDLGENPCLAVSRFVHVS